MNKLILLPALVALGCGGVDDLTNPDYRVVHVLTSTYADGHEETVRTVGEVDLNWDTQDTDITGPWADENGDVQKFAYGANSRYGVYSAGTATDGRCPNSWSSPQYCAVPGIKSFKWLYYPSLSNDGINDADLWTEWVQAQSVSSYGGFSHCSGLACAGAPPFNAWFDASNGSCPSGTVACQATTEGSVFTSGGKRFRKTIPFDAFGWDAGFDVYTAINLEPAAINTYNAAATTVVAFRANNVQNTLEHELAHANGNHHNPGGGTTREVLQTPERFYDPGTSMLSAEITAANSYTP